MSSSIDTRNARQCRVWRPSVSGCFVHSVVPIRLSISCDAGRQPNVGQPNESHGIGNGQPERLPRICRSPESQKCVISGCVRYISTAGEGKTPDGGAHRCDEETHQHSQHHGSDRPTLAGASDQLTKNGVLEIAHQNADKASSKHRNNWLSLVWLRPHGFESTPGHTPFRQPWL